MNNTINNSYGQILKSTTLVGGSQVINTLLGIVRTKFLAVLLGPAGIGLIGLYQSIIDMIGTVSSLGIGGSGVRQIAEAESTGDKQKIARTIKTLRRVSIILGLLGMILMLIFTMPLSSFTFGTSEHAWPLAILSITLLFSAISGGQRALVQGTRRISDLAKLSIWGGVLGTVISIPMIFLWGKDGIVPFLVTVSATSILTSWWYARKIPVAKILLGWRETFIESKQLFSLGIVFMATTLMGTAVLYLIRLLIIRYLGMDSVGLYQAAVTLSAIYIGVILNAMGMDFYPRLTAIAKDDNACNRLVNEQTEVGLLIALPGILATLTFAPLIIQLFYSSSFVPAFEVLQWQIMGIFLRVVTWPMSYILLAKGKGKIFFWTELLAQTVFILFTWTGIVRFGLIGTGIAFFCLYVFRTSMNLVVVNAVSNFKWSISTIRLIIISCICIFLTFLMPHFTTNNFAMTFGAIMTFSSAFFAVQTLYSLVGPKRVIDFLKKLKDNLKFRKH